MATPDLTVVEQTRPVREWRPLPVVWLLVSSIFALAYFSPVEHVDSDPAIALLVAQSLLDHHTLRLDAYRDDPACAYDLEQDYRIRRQEGSYAYYSLGVPLLSLPAVWLANRAGYHMLDQDDEFALQNLLSALCCAALGLLLYRICRVYLGSLASLFIASISLLGSSLSSTLATGLWNAGYAILFLALGLLHLVRREKPGAPPLNPLYLALLAALAFLCRPTAAFAILATILALMPWSAMWRRRTWLLAALVLTSLVAFFTVLGGLEWLPKYYSPRKLMPKTPLSLGLYAALLSPSRGLLVFSPFLILVAATGISHLRALASDRLFRLASVWTGLHVLAISIKGNWWGGHSYGPRLLTEVMLPAALLTCLAWRQLVLSSRPRTRRIIAAVYLVCGLAAIFIHSYQGLFNPHTRRWNWTPDIDRNPSLAFDWEHPQFLATARSLEQRLFDQKRLELSTYDLGESIAFNGDGALFHDWYSPEEGWRWSRGRSPEILLRLGELASPGPYLLKLHAASLGTQDIGLLINNTPVGRIELDGEVRIRAFAFERDLLRPGQENSLRFDIPGATATATDSRVMGLALHQFELEALSSDDEAAFGGVEFSDHTFFVLGFSDAERAWRWTDGRRAVIDYPVGDTTNLDTLVLEASVLDRQSVSIELNGVRLGELVFEGDFDTVVARQLTFDPALLRPYRMNRVGLILPQARPTAGDPRLLGLAFARLELKAQQLTQPAEQPAPIIRDHE